MVLLVLVLAPDAYAAFGLVFVVLAAALVLAGARPRLTVPRGQRRVWATAAHT